MSSVQRNTKIIKWALLFVLRCERNSVSADFTTVHSCEPFFIEIVLLLLLSLQSNLWFSKLKFTLNLRKGLIFGGPQTVEGYINFILSDWCQPICRGMIEIEPVNVDTLLLFSYTKKVVVVCMVRRLIPCRLYEHIVCISLPIEEILCVIELRVLWGIDGWIKIGYESLTSLW